MNKEKLLYKIEELKRFRKGENFSCDTYQVKKLRSCIRGHIVQTKNDIEVLNDCVSFLIGEVEKRDAIINRLNKLSLKLKSELVESNNNLLEVKK
jgi:hypothetical protein